MSKWRSFGFGLAKSIGDFADTDRMLRNEQRWAASVKASGIFVDEGNRTGIGQAFIVIAPGAQAVADLLLTAWRG